jgi:hypothetical protein
MWFLSRFSKTGLGIIPFRRTLLHFRPYTFKQPDLRIFNFRLRATLFRRLGVTAPTARVAATPHIAAGFNIPSKRQVQELVKIAAFIIRERFSIDKAALAVEFQRRLEGRS